MHRVTVNLLAGESQEISSILLGEASANVSPCLLE